MLALLSALCPGVCVWKTSKAYLRHVLERLGSMFFWSLTKAHDGRQRLEGRSASNLRVLHSCSALLKKCQKRDLLLLFLHLLLSIIIIIVIIIIIFLQVVQFSVCMGGISLMQPCRWRDKPGLFSDSYLEAFRAGLSKVLITSHFTC